MCDAVVRKTIYRFRDCMKQSKYVQTFLNSSICNKRTLVDRVHSWQSDTNRFNLLDKTATLNEYQVVVRLDRSAHWSDIELERRNSRKWYFHILRVMQTSDGYRVSSSQCRKSNESQHFSAKFRKRCRPRVFYLFFLATPRSIIQNPRAKTARTAFIIVNIVALFSPFFSTDECAALAWKKSMVVLISLSFSLRNCFTIFSEVVSI